MTKLFIIIGAAVASIAALADLHHFERLKFLAEPKWVRVRAVVCLLGIVISGLAGGYAERESAARERESATINARLTTAQETIAEKQATIAQQQAELLAHSRLTADQQEKIIKILEGPRYRDLPRDQAFRRFYLDLIEELKVETKAATELAMEVQRGGDYRPLLPEIRVSALARLRPVAEEARQRGLKVSLSVQAHGEDDNRSRVVRDLAALMRDAGLDASIEAIQIIVGRPVGSPAAICFHPAHEAIARALAEALEPMVKTPWVGVKNEASDKCPRDTLRMQITAIPRFNYRDGTVEFR